MAVLGEKRVVQLRAFRVRQNNVEQTGQEITGVLVDRLNPLDGRIDLERGRNIADSLRRPRQCITHVFPTANFEKMLLRKRLFVTLVPSQPAKPPRTV